MITNKTIEERVGDIEKRLLILEGGASSDFTTLSPKVKKVSTKEFLMTKGLKMETQKALALAYYLEHIEGMQSFNITDLETAFRSAKERLPKNINDTVNKNISKGFLMDALEKKDNKKAWVMTSTGERYVEDGLNKLK